MCVGRCCRVVLMWLMYFPKLKTESIVCQDFHHSLSPGVLDFFLTIAGSLFHLAISVVGPSEQQRSVTGGKKSG